MFHKTLAGIGRNMSRAEGILYRIMHKNRYRHRPKTKRQAIRELADHYAERSGLLPAEDWYDYMTRDVQEGLNNMDMTEDRFRLLGELNAELTREYMKQYHQTYKGAEYNYEWHDKNTDFDDPVDY